MKPCVIGLVGYRKSGKSTAAERLHLTHGYVRLPFAKPLKDMLCAIGLTDAHLDGSLKEKPCSLLLGATPRRAMQTLGTDWARDMIHPDIWINLWKNAVHRQRGKPVVAEDVRFPNEAAAVRSLGGVLVRIERAEAVASDHASETELDGIECRYVIRNDGPIGSLAETIDEFIAGCAYDAAEALSARVHLRAGPRREAAL